VEAPSLPVAYWRLPSDRGRGTPIHSNDLESILVEVAGRRALQEVVLDRVLALELTRRSIVPDAAAVAQEKTILLEALDPSNPQRAAEFLKEIRRREGLGPVRFAALLRRNAGLRAMIQEEIQINEEALLAAWDARHGPRRIARVFVAPDIASCTTALEKVNSGEPFSEVAAQGSMDPSSATGGLVDPVARLDPSWPTSFRETLWSLELGATSSPVLVDGDYVLVHFVTEEPGDGVDFTTGRVEALDTVRRAQERLLMDSTAKRLLESTQVDIIDSEFGRAWRNDPGTFTSSSMPSARTQGE
jgi:hypothetical protein